MGKKVTFKILLWLNCVNAISLWSSLNINKTKRKLCIKEKSVTMEALWLTKILSDMQNIQ